MSSKVLGVILAGGKGTRLGKLTQNQAKPDVPFGGRFRIIDFTLSNCANSNITNVGIITQYQPLKLNTHIGNGASWGLGGLASNVKILQPYTDTKGSNWFQGTAHAIYQNIDYIDEQDPDYVLILSGDHIYKMDYDDLLEQHKHNHASLTVAVIDVPMKEASRFGIMNTDATNRIVDFQEKPEKPKSNHASMGIYIFNWKRLREVLTTSFSSDEDMMDFGKNVIPFYLSSGDPVFAYKFDGYWRDVGTIDSLWEANMELLDEDNDLNLYDDSWKIYSRSHCLPPQWISPTANIQGSMITDGCYIDGEVEHSIISTGVSIKRGAKVIDSIIMPGSVIDKGAVIKHAIIGENAYVGADAVIDAENEIAVVGNEERVGVLPNEE